MASKSKITQDKINDTLSRITPIVDLHKAVSDTDLVIEVVPEIMTLKRKVYAELDDATPETTMFASNTSTLPITEIASVTSRPNHFIGIHFFNPPQLMKLVEIIPGEKTSKEMIDLTMQYVQSLDKEAIICRKDVPGFIVNRLFIPLVHEACHAKDRTGASFEEIDSAVKFNLGFPMGIFELADFTGMDVIHKATEEMHMRDKKVINPHPTIKKMFEEKKLGKKSGSGFYEYSSDKYQRVSLSAELAQKFDPIQLVANIINNAAWLISNGASDADEIEKAARLGLGLKIPLFETTKKIGIDKLVHELETLASLNGETYTPDPLLYAMMKQ